MPLLQLIDRHDPTIQDRALLARHDRIARDIIPAPVKLSAGSRVLVMPHE